MESWNHTILHVPLRNGRQREKWKTKREQNVKSKMSETKKVRRKKLRGLRKSFGDRKKELEWGDSYDSGGFS